MAKAKRKEVGQEREMKERGCAEEGHRLGPLGSGSPARLLQPPPRKARTNNSVIGPKSAYDETVRLQVYIHMKGRECGCEGEVKVGGLILGDGVRMQKCVCGEKSKYRGEE